MGAAARLYTMTIGDRQIAAPVRGDILNPADGPLVGGSPTSTASRLQNVLGAAAATQPPFAARSRAERRAACEGIARILSEDAREPAAFVTREEGKPPTGLGWEFELAACAARALCAASLDLPPKVIDASPDGRIERYREPIGVVGSMVPWKRPLLIARHIVPALCIGNTVAMTPSPVTTPGTLPRVERLQEALHPCLLNAVAGDDALGAQLSRHPHSGQVVSAGSAAAGRKVMASAVSALKQFTLEFGGNDPGIALADADVGQTVERVFRHACINSGRNSAALQRLSVHESLHERYCAVLHEHAGAVPTGAGMPEEARLGPWQNEPQLETVSELVENAKRQGGKLCHGGERSKGRGFLYCITLVDAVSDGVRPMDEMPFALRPPIVRCGALDEPVLLANASGYGLAARVPRSGGGCGTRVHRRARAADTFPQASSCRGRPRSWGCSR